MKKVYKLKLKIKVILLFALVLIALYTIFAITNAPRTTKKVKDIQSIKKQEKVVREEINVVLEEEPPIEEIEEFYTTRMTSYYPEEGETTTASGLGINNFETNDKGWFTYNGKLVIATASTRLGSTNMETYNLYDEIILTIDGIDYDAIVLDVCGACMRDNRIDLFVSSYVYAKDTTIQVRRK